MLLLNCTTSRQITAHLFATFNLYCVPKHSVYFLLHAKEKRKSDMETQVHMMGICSILLCITTRYTYSHLLLCKRCMILCSDEATCVYRGGHTDAGASWDCGSGGSFSSEVCMFVLLCINQCQVDVMRSEVQWIVPQCCGGTRSSGG